MTTTTPRPVKVNASERYIRVAELQHEIATEEVNRVHAEARLEQLRRELSRYEHSIVPLRRSDFEHLYRCQFREPDPDDATCTLQCMTEFKRWEHEQPTPEDLAFCDEHRPKPLPMPDEPKPTAESLAPIAQDEIPF